MKKIFRMALMLTLAGSALLYTSCTKDYSDDIDDLKTEVSALKQTVSQLQSAINGGAVITNVAATDAGYLVTLSDGQKFEVKNGAAGKDGKDGATGAEGHSPVVTIGDNGNWFIDGKDTGKPSQGKDGAAGAVSSITIENGYICIDGVSTGVMAGTAAIWDAAKGTVTFKGIGTDGADVVIGLCELESIVFVPQLYFEGIEAVEYDYLAGDYFVAKKAAEDQELTKKDDEGATITLTQAGKHEWLGKADAPKAYALGELATAQYHINPSAFDVANAEWALAGADQKQMTRAAEAWKPVYKSIENNKGTADVKYQIENPDKATLQEDKGKKVSVMKLDATVKSGEKLISSDYEAIVPFKEALKALAFTKASGYVTKADTYKTVGSFDKPCIHTDATIKPTELYLTSSQAAYETASVGVQYQESKDLAEIINVHMYPASETSVHAVDLSKEIVISIADLQKKYPELKVNFELVPYKLGGHVSEEQMYGQIEGTTFYPCYVEADGKTQVRADKAQGELHGVSAVGRKPIVLVTLSDGKDVVLYGYFKIVINRDITVKKDFIIKEFDQKVPYLCEVAERSTTWAEASYIVLEKEMGMTYTEFLEKYGKKVEKDNTYIKNAKGEFVLVNTATVKDYGTFKYTPDNEGAGINDKFAVTFTKEQADNVVKDYKGTITLYKKFGTTSDYVFIGLTASIDDPAKVTFTQHNPAYWFKAADHAETDVVFVNPLVPNKTDDDVKVYDKKLDDNWVYNRVEIKLDATSEAAYKDVWNGLVKKYHYELLKDQTCTVKIGDKTEKVVANTTLDALYLTKVDAANLLVSLDKQVVRSYQHIAGTEVITNGPAESGVITYYHNGTTADCISKQVLNLYAHPKNTKTPALEENLADLLYADVALVATYDSCDIPCGTEKFHAAFFRPVDILQGSPKALKDAVPTGDNVIVGELFSAKDWQNYDIFAYNTKTKAYEDCWYVNPTSGTKAVNWYIYYGFRELTIDTAKISTDQTGTVDLISKINPAAKVWVAKKATPETKESDTINIAAGASVLGDYVFHYENNTGVVQNFNLYVPIKVAYWWGVVEATITVPVQATV